MSAATPSSRALLDRLRQGWRSSPLPGFFAWWGGELGTLLPPRWRAALADGAGWHLLQQVDGDWRLRRAGQAEPLARWSDELDPVAQQAALAVAWQGTDPEDRRLALLLPAHAVLRRVLQLPVAARGKLHQVAGYEMDRQTPFGAAQVYYAVRELARPDDAGRLGVDLLPPDQASHRTRPRRRLNLMLAAACVLLLLLAMGGWLHNRENALTQMQAQVEAMRGEAQQVAGLRKQLQDDAGAAGFLAQRKARRATVLGVLLDLTKRLPSSAWLERFSLDDNGQIGFQGQSPQAAKLLDLLKGSPLIDNANFQGSIQSDPSTGKERFYLLALLLSYFLLLHWWFVAPLRDIAAQMDDLRDTQSRYAAAIAEQPQLRQRIAA